MLVFLLTALPVLVPVGLGLYLLIVGRINLIRGSLEGPLVRLLGAFLILSPIICLPVILRWLVGMTMNLGH